MTERFDSISVQLQLTSGVWTDVSEDVIGAIKVQDGFSGNGPLDRVASTGTMKLTLENNNNHYTPTHANCLSGFTNNVACRILFGLRARQFTKFYGHIESLSFSESGGLAGFTTLTVVGFMNALAIHELDLPAFTTAKKMDEIVPLILANMPVQPLSTSYGTGRDTFGTVFDTVSSKTRAIQELSKLALSELGYVYVRPTSTSDEVLITEGRGARNGAVMDTVYVWDGVISHLLTEAGGHIFTETYDPAVESPDTDTEISLEYIYTAQPALLSNSTEALKLSYADNYYNAVKTVVYPRRVDTSAKVLYNLERALQISAGQTITMTGRFVDPDQEAQSVAGKDMIDPAATTDYLLNTAADGSGTNITASLAVTATYGTNGVNYSLKNNNASTGYVTKLQARGTGVYIYRKAENIQTDAALVTAEGKRMLSLNMEYQDNPLVGADITTYLLSQHKNKITTLESVTFVANSSDYLMNAFVDLGIGDKIEIVEDTLDLDRAFFINSIDFTVQPGGIVLFTYGMKDSTYETFDAWILGTSALGTTTILGF